LKNTFKIFGILLFGIIAYLFLDVLFFHGVKSYYCLSENNCITVWKKTANDVYIIPGIYKGNDVPDISHIKTINGQYLTLYFSEDLPQKIIVRDQGNYENNQKGYSIEKGAKGEWQILEYSESYKSTLYNPEAVKFKDVKSSTNYIDLNIQENYATDKSGKKIL
jgi:hypothetical protein